MRRPSRLHRPRRGPPRNCPRRGCARRPRRYALTRRPIGQANRALRVLMAEPQRALVCFDQLVLALEALGDEPFHHGEIDVQKRGERADIDHVLVKLPLLRIRILRGADLGHRHRDDFDVAAQHRRRQRTRRIVEEIAARLDGRDVLCKRLRVHGHEHVGPAARAEPAFFAHPYFIPGRQALDV